MKTKLKVQAVAIVVSAMALTGCFEPSGKNFEGKWIKIQGGNLVKPTMVNVSCGKGFCEFQKIIWFFPEGKYADPEVSNAKIENEELVVWSGYEGSAKIKDGKMYWNADVYERRE